MPEDDNCPRNSRADCFFSRERCSFVSLKWREIFQQRAADVPTLGLDYLRAKKETRTIKFKIASSSGNSTDGYIEKDSTLMIRQDLAKFGIGGVVWDCGEALAVFIGRHQHLVAGKRVIDLGTGTGIAGLAAAQCGARHTVLSDRAALRSLVLDNINHNVGFSPSGVCFTPFYWDDTGPKVGESKQLLDDGLFDLVLCSDCMYEPRSFTSFRQALLTICHAETEVLISYKRRLDRRRKKYAQQA